MDKCVGKRAISGDSLSRRGSGIVFRDHNQEDRIIQNRSRLQCSSRVSSAGGSQNGTPEKPKQLRASLRPVSGKAIAGNSSKPFAPSCSHRKSFREHQKQTFLQEKDVVGSSYRVDDIESDSEQVPQDNAYSGRQGIQQVSISVPKTTNTLRSSIFEGISTDIIKLSSSSGVASSSKGHRQINGHMISGHQEASSKSLMPSSSFSSGNTTLTRAPRCGLNNLGCALVPDVFPSGHSPFDLVGDGRIDMARKKSSDGESSASSSRGPSTTTNGGYPGSVPLETSVQNVLIPRRLMLEPVSRRNRNRITIRENASSVRTRRTSQPSAEGRVSPLLPSEAILIPQLHQQARNSVPGAVHVHENSSGAFASELPRVFNNSFGRSSSNNRGARSRAAILAQDSRTQVPYDPLGDAHSYRHFNVEGVAEVLSALERIEQDEALTYEHLLFLESNLLRGSLRFHDQHRDLRMDIDNMSYEELLALEERMGTVSTALTDDQLSKCLKRTTFTRAYFVPGTNSYDDDDAKCSVCQEEYINGDEMGTLECEHRYHVACINQWLRQKNWCPICKSCALPSSPDTTQG